MCEGVLVALVPFSTNKNYLKKNILKENGYFCDTGVMRNKFRLNTKNYF